LGAFKKAVWEEFLASPPDEAALELAIQLDGIITSSAEHLAKIEAAHLLDTLSHQKAARHTKAGSPVEEEVKGGFVSVAAHELKTPLTVIEGYSNMLKMELSDGSHPRAALMVQGLESGVVRLRELIEDLIDVSLIEMGLLGMDMQPTWLRRVWAIVEFEAKPVAQQRNLTLMVEVDTIPNQPTLGDPERLLKAFQKILANAMKYTPDGGRILVRARKVNTFVDITVVDSGIGIASENLDRIFEKFSAIGDITRHSSGKTKFKGGGAGLGLVIAKGIIEAHGGVIWAESPGFDETACPGSKFHIMLPLREAKPSDSDLSPLIASALEILQDAKIPENASGQGPADRSPAGIPAEVKVISPERPATSAVEKKDESSPSIPQTKTGQPEAKSEARKGD
jgi:signal transduction histidine kinase